MGVPLNTLGYQTPRTGNGYAGFAAYVDTINSREYLEVELDSILAVGQKYCVEFYVSLADSTGIAVTNIGAYFSSDSLLDSTYHTIDYIVPQVENSVWNMLNDKTNWIKIFGVFTAQGGEKFMTIGNFHKPSNTNFQNVGATGMLPNRSYYYIDDISVTACDTTLIGINETAKQEDFFKLYPNPNNGSFTVDYSIEEYDQADLCIYSVEGRKIACHKLNSAEKKIKIQENLFSNGMYFYQIHLNGKVEMQDKMIIIK